MSDFIEKYSEHSISALMCFDKIGSEVHSMIHHYTSAGGLLGILNEEKIKLWFTQYDSLNDKNERVDALETLITYCKIKFEEKVISEELLERVKGITFSDLITTSREVDEEIDVGDGEKVTKVLYIDHEDCYTYLCCFSKNSDSLAMWNYYSKSSKYEGYNIGIYLNQHCVSKNKKGYELVVRKVIYTQEEKFKLFDELLLPLLCDYEEASFDNKNMIFNIIKMSIDKVQFVFKNDHFKHEEEVRAILRVPKQFVSDDMVSKRLYRESNGYIIPYVELSLQKNVLKQVTIAPLFEQTFAKNNLESLLTQRKYSSVKVCTSTVPVRF